MDAVKPEKSVLLMWRLTAWASTLGDRLSGMSLPCVAPGGKV